jgi:Arm DNA-binding domain
MTLTIKEIEGARTSSKSYKLADRDGLCLLIAPSGSKLWRWRYRFEGKEKMMALGEYPLVSLAQVRELLLAARKTLASGIDPMVQRKAKAEAKREAVAVAQREVENSFEKVARKWWEWWSEGKTPRHTDTVMRRLEGDVFPAFGRKFIEAVTAADVRDAMRVAARHAIARLLNCFEPLPTSYALRRNTQPPVPTTSNWDGAPPQAPRGNSNCQPGLIEIP